MSKSNPAYKTEPLTDEEYLSVEREAFEKSEFINGRVLQRTAAVRFGKSDCVASATVDENGRINSFVADATEIINQF